MFKALGGVVAITFYATSILTASAQSGWSVYRNPDFEYELLYPPYNFEADTSRSSETTSVFRSTDGGATLTAFGSFNEENMSIANYRATIIRDFPGYDKITYGPMTATWFVLSGFRGGDVYYQKVMFACGGKVVNVFALKYPAVEKWKYDPIVVGVERNFRPTSESACARLVRRG